MNKSMEIYTDATFNEREGVAGYGIIKCSDGKERPISNFINCESINEAELFAIYTACVWSGGEKCRIITDSQCALSYIKNQIQDKPRTQKQFIRHKKCEFWACKIRQFKNIKFEKVKAHTNYFQYRSVNNKIADAYADKGFTKYIESQLRGY